MGSLRFSRSLPSLFSFLFFFFFLPYFFPASFALHLFPSFVLSVCISLCWLVLVFVALKYMHCGFVSGLLLFIASAVIARLDNLLICVIDQKFRLWYSILL